MSTVIASGLTPGRFLAVEGVVPDARAGNMVELRIYEEGLPHPKLHGNIYLNEVGAGALAQALLTAFEGGDVKAYLTAIAAREGLEITVKPKPPTWQEEDVVLVNHSGRERTCFVADLISNEEPVTDSFGDTHPITWLDELYREGRARLVMRDGRR